MEDLYTKIIEKMTGKGYTFEIKHGSTRLILTKENYGTIEVILSETEEGTLERSIVSTYPSEGTTIKKEKIFKDTSYIRDIINSYYTKTFKCLF